MRSISPHIAWLAAVALGASPARAAGGDFVTKSQHYRLGHHASSAQESASSLG